MASNTVCDSLLFQIAADFARHGLFLHTSRGVVSKQQGVMRTNCIDCLDRTNVVQGMLARKVGRTRGLRKNASNNLQQLSRGEQGGKARAWTGPT